MDTPIFISTTNISGSYDVLGLVHGTSVRAASLVKDAYATARNLIGGEMEQYGQLIDEAIGVAKERMLERAKALGANAVIGTRIATSDVVVGGAEIIVYGTAVRLNGSNAL